jgi:hypothetical protein
MSHSIDPVAQFRTRRRIGLWFGAALPGLLFLASLLSFRVAHFPWWVGVGCLVVAIGVSVPATRQYRCTVCGKSPEPDLPTFFPESCCHCNVRLR